MSKLSIAELTSTKLSNHLVACAASIKGGSESACHPEDPITIDATVVNEDGNG